jgi:hypothetical protein
VKVYGGVISSALPSDVLNGRNLAAIGDGTPGSWEVFQFADAELVAPQTYDLRTRLRGQAGTDAGLPGTWPSGSVVVFLDRGVEQLDLPLSARGLERHYRIGVAQRGYDDPTVLHRTDAIAGAGLRPYAPVHLRAQRSASGDVTFAWVRRTRVDGDSWMSVEVPLGEEQQEYRLVVRLGNLNVRTVTTVESTWVYSSSLQTMDGISGIFEVEVSQISVQFGAGRAASMTVFG